MATSTRGSTTFGSPASTTQNSTSNSRINSSDTSPRYVTTSNQVHTGENTTLLGPLKGRPNTIRPSTSRPRTAASTLGIESQEIICAISESRGISPTVGLAFVNLETCEAVLSQICDSQTYVRTVHKLTVYYPSNILVVASAMSPKSKLFSILEDSLAELNCNMTLLDRRYWAETAGMDYIDNLAFAEEVEAIKTAVTGNYFAVCCFAAVLKYVELGMAKTFPLHSLRIKYEPPEGSMMVDLSTIRALELVQNLQSTRSKDSLFGLLNHTLTPMGSRLLRSNILQPTTNSDVLNNRWDALEELSTKEDMFFNVRQALKTFVDVDKMLTRLIIIPVQPTLKDIEYAINNVLMLKQFINLIEPVFEALTGACRRLLRDVREMCAAENLAPIKALLAEKLNADTTYAKRPLDLRNQRTYAVKSGVNGLLDVARQTYTESITDAIQHITELEEEHGLSLQTCYDDGRQFYVRLRSGELEHRNLPPVFVNVVRKKDMIECQTMELLKRNQRITDAHSEVLLMSDNAVAILIDDLRKHMSICFKICEGIALLDMLSAFAHLVTTQEYVRPSIAESTLAIRAGRHPLRELIQQTKFVPNDIYATRQNRFQIITGCNMSGKSTYIRTVALITVMCQIGSFVPAEYAAFPIVRQLFARVSTDDNIEANISTFAAEMRETAFILRNIDGDSLAIIDELGRGTSTRDGLAIALAISEALVESRALVWFATHFHDLATIMSERAGVQTLHLAVDLTAADRIEMLYRISAGTAEEQHYGLQLAKVVPLPADVVEHAELVAMTLEQQVLRRQRQKKSSLAVVIARRRKLILNLREHLVQAKESNMGDVQLKTWLKELQTEFVVRMSALDEEEGEVLEGIVESESVTEAEVAEQIPAEVVVSLEGAGEK